MSRQTPISDDMLLNLLAKGPLGVADSAAALGVTATAIRQRLTRLMSKKLIKRETVFGRRGRPKHLYHFVEKWPEGAIQ